MSHYFCSKLAPNIVNFKSSPDGLKLEATNQIQTRVI